MSGLDQLFGGLRTAGRGLGAERIRIDVISENIANSRDLAMLSRDLVRLDNDVPIEIDWDAAKIQEPNHERLLELYTDFAFGRFADEMRKQVAEVRRTPVATVPPTKNYRRCSVALVSALHRSYGDCITAHAQSAHVNEQLHLRNAD